MLKQLQQLNWQKNDGLLPVVIQHIDTYQVLMLGYMNQEALKQSLASKYVTFYSRSKKRLWMKGETSGHKLELVSVHADCDQDSLLVFARPLGPTCHLQQNNCFALPAQHHHWEFLDKLIALIEERKNNGVSKSYVSDLMQNGVARIAKKVGEEAVEAAIAAVDVEANNFVDEMSDLFFHCFILLSAKNISLQNVINTLEKRHKMRCGHEQTAP